MWPLQLAQSVQLAQIMAEDPSSVHRGLCCDYRKPCCLPNLIRTLENDYKVIHVLSYKHNPHAISDSKYKKHSYDAQRIEVILDRNRKIKENLATLDKIANTSLPLNLRDIDAHQIRDVLDKIINCGLKHPDLDEYITFFSGVLCLIDGDNQHALQKFLSSFTKQEFGVIANALLPHTLMTLDPSAFKNIQQKWARYFLMANTCPNLDETSAKCGLIGIANPQTEITLGELNNFERVVGADKLVSLKEIIRIANNCYRLIPSHECFKIDFLASIIDSIESKQTLWIKYLWKLEIFREEFCKEYPGSRSFRVLENYLLHPTRASIGTDILSVDVDIESNIKALATQYYTEKSRTNVSDEPLQKLEDKARKILQAHLYSTLEPIKICNKLMQDCIIMLGNYIESRKKLLGSKFTIFKELRTKNQICNYQLAIKLNNWLSCGTYSTNEILTDKLFSERNNIMKQSTNGKVGCLTRNIHSNELNKVIDLLKQINRINPDFKLTPKTTAANSTIASMA